MGADQKSTPLSVQSSADVAVPLQPLSSISCFLDAGKVFDNKEKPTNANESIRSSYGLGIKLYTPIGPLGFSWAFPISSESYDIERDVFS